MSKVKLLLNNISNWELDTDDIYYDSGQ